VKNNLKFAFINSDARPAADGYPDSGAAQNSIPSRAEASAQPILRDIAHELRLQFLGATFSADVQCPFQFGQLIVPWSQMHDHDLALGE
jgi:hypothetical protein